MHHLGWDVVYERDVCDYYGDGERGGVHVGEFEGEVRGCGGEVYVWQFGEQRDCFHECGREVSGGRERSVERGEGGEWEHAG